MRKNSVKNNRLNQEVMRELSSLIRNELKDPRIPMMTSITDVFVAPDLKTAKIYISVLGDEVVQAGAMEGLKSAAPFLRSRLAKEMNLRNTPELTFLPDQSIEYAINMSKKIDDVMGRSEEASEEEEDDEE